MNQLSLMSLDPTTCMFCMSLFGFVMSAISYSTSITLGCRVSGLQEWAKAMLATGVSFFLFYLRGRAPEFVTVLLANICVLFVLLYSILAHARFFNVVAPKRALFCLWSVGIAGTSVSYYLTSDRSALVVAISLPVAFLLLLLTLMIVQNVRWREQRSTWISLSAMLLMAIELFIRSFRAVFGDHEGAAVLAKTGAQFGFLVSGALCIMGTSMGFILMVHEKIRMGILENAKRDGLTGLYHRSAFFECASAIEALDEDAAYAVVMVDIDFFKSINDTYGHSSGDLAITHVARLISNSVRNTDVAGRYGGEEFCIFLRGCGEEEAAKFAVRLVDEASKQRIRLTEGREVNLTISAGYAWRRSDGGCVIDRTAKSLLEDADQALLVAKRTGRNRAVAANYVALSNFDTSLLA